MNYGFCHPHDQEVQGLDQKIPIPLSSNSLLLCRAVQLENTLLETWEQASCAPPAQSSLTGTWESEEASASIPFSPSFLCYRETLLFSLHFLFFTCNQHNRILPGSNSGLPMVSSSLVHQKTECIRKMCMFIFSLSGGKRLINGPI